jgi:hypothetical protein
MIKLDIPPFLTYVRSEYLFDHKEGDSYFSPATVFSISISKDEYPTFQVIINDTTLFSNIPISAFANSKGVRPLEESNYIYFHAPNENVIACTHDYLSSIEDCFVWQRNAERFQAAKYILTIDWYLENKQLHLLELEDGNYILWPSELITFGSNVPEKLPAYGRVGN